MLTVPPPSPSTPATNRQGVQLLSNPNITSISNMQQWQRMGRPWPSGLPAIGSAANWPTAGFSSATPGLSQNPMQGNQMQNMIAALQGQR